MSRRFRFRPKPPFAPKHEKHFRWRGKEVSRLEGFTDAVFAFAVTLLVVALEVPHTYEGLIDVVRSFPAFVICFALLMMFWSAHYRFFRRYGMEDFVTRVLTMAILVLVLFAVYPLKFLFTLVTAQVFHLSVAHTPHLDSDAQVRNMFVIYGLGLAGVWVLYALLYQHAFRRRHELGLNAGELIQTRMSLWECWIYVGTSLLSILLACVTNSQVLPGVIYCILGPLQTMNARWHRKKIRALDEARPQAVEQTV